MPVAVVDHPLVADKMARLRAWDTDSATFRSLARDLASLLAYEATRSLPTVEVDVRTPLDVHARCRVLAAPGPILVPILRAGLGLLDGALDAIPSATVGVIGLRRDETTFAAEQYCVKLPDDLAGRHAVVLDPMLATGGSLAQTCALLRERGVATLAAIALIAAPEGIERVLAVVPDLDIVCAAIDDHLDERAYIVPGLGDAGDRLFGPA